MSKDLTYCNYITSEKSPFYQTEDWPGTKVIRCALMYLLLHHKKIHAHGFPCRESIRTFAEYFNRILNWMSRFQSGFWIFSLDFWISIGFLPTVYEISFMTEPLCGNVQYETYKAKPLPKGMLLGVNPPPFKIPTLQNPHPPPTWEGSNKCIIMIHLASWMEGESQEAILTAKHPQVCRRSKIMHAYRAHRDIVHRAVGLACIHHPTGIANSHSLEPATKTHRFAPYDKWRHWSHTCMRLQGRRARKVFPHLTVSAQFLRFQLLTSTQPAMPGVFHWGPLTALTIITVVTISSTYSALQLWGLPPSRVKYFRLPNFVFMYVWLVLILKNFYQALKGPGYVPLEWKPVRTKINLR